MATATKSRRCVLILRSNLLVILTFLGAAVGFGIGIGIRQYSPSDGTLMWIGILGEMYMNMLKMMIVPLIVCSVISGTASLDPKSNGKISMISLSFIMMSNFIPCLVGALLCLTIKPGRISEETSMQQSGHTNIGTQDIFADLLRDLAVFTKFFSFWYSDKSRVFPASTAIGTSIGYFRQWSDK